MDIVSELPDHLLLKVLSLIPIEEAIATSFLSKRWHNLWTCLDRLDFSCDDRLLHNFVSFVDNVLLRLSNSTVIREFVIQVDYSPQYKNQFNRFLSWAVGRNVRIVFLNFQPDIEYDNYPPNPFYEMSQTVCTCSTFRFLCISKCQFPQSGVISWMCLTRLTMAHIVLDDDLMVKVLSGCPVLERLQLITFVGITHLCITNPNVKELMLAGYWFDGYYRDDNVLTITAPYIQELEISGCMYDLQCKLLDLSSLVSANIEFEHRWTDDFHDHYNEYYDISLKVGKYFIQRVAHVKELTLGKWMIQVLSMLGMQSSSYSLSNCKSLTLNAYITDFETPALISLLYNSPQLGTLFINMDYVTDFFTRSGEPLHHETEKFLELQQRNVECLLHFKNVKIESRQYCCLKMELIKEWEKCNSEDNEEAVLDDEDVDMLTKELSSNKEMFRALIFEQDKGYKMAEYLLMNVKVLEKVVITSLREVCDTCSTCCAFEYLSLVLEKLSTVPKSSTGAVIQFVEKQP